MTDYNQSFESHLIFETAEHVTTAKQPFSSSTAPSRMTWGDIHDPDGEESPTIGEQFKDALEKLERICYVVWGSLPKAYAPSFVQWYYRLHPRCMWHAEQVVENWCGVSEEPDHYESYNEFGALGEAEGTPSYPSVPIRSRSGDWRLQMLDSARTHDTTFFPRWSVSRFDGTQLDNEGRQTFDPKGDGVFGETPGGMDEVGTFGDEYAEDENVEITGEDVEITYTAPAAIADLIDSVTIYTDVEDPVNMAEDPAGTWKGDIPAQDHGTEVHWYLKIVAGETTRYEPGGESEPAEAEQYTYKAFSHWNPYPYGLPELYSACAKGTDRYQFTPEETIQPGLINLARFVLDKLGEELQHSPEVRSYYDDGAEAGELNYCCMDMPIRWRWSGSAPWPHYVARGKDDTDHVTPLHNLSGEAGSYSTVARPSWRGCGHYGSDNPYFGPGESWLAIPDYLEIEEDPETPGDYDVFWTGDDRGLQPGDVIDLTHILEIIEAVDYLYTEGLWLPGVFKRRVATPTWELDGLECGENSTYPNPGSIYNECWDGSYPTHSELSEPADWETCWDDEESPDTFGICYMQLMSGSEGRDDPSPGLQMRCTIESEPGTLATCGGSGSIMDCTECGEDCEEPTCDYVDYYTTATQFVTAGASSYGWGYWLCGPMVNPGDDGSSTRGVDANHGNGLRKERANTNAGCTGAGYDMPRSNGNKLSRAFICGRDDADTTSDVSFESVELIRFDGAGWNWYNWAKDPDWPIYQPTPYDPEDAVEQGRANWKYTDLMPLAGGGGYAELQNLCSITYTKIDDEEDLPDEWDTNLDCSKSVDCNELWVEIDQNRDGNGMPQLYDYATDAAIDAYDNAEEYPERWINCPMQTWTGAEGED